MAYEALVDPELTAAIQRYVEHLSSTRNVSLVALLKSSLTDFAPKWNLVISGPDFDRFNPNAVVLAVAQDLKKQLPPKFFSSIDRITLLPISSELVEHVWAEHRQVNKPVRLADVPFEGEWTYGLLFLNDPARPNQSPRQHYVQNRR